MLVVADRLLPIQEVLDMPMSHFNLWIAYLKKSKMSIKTKDKQQQLTKYR